MKQLCIFTFVFTSAAAAAVAGAAARSQDGNKNALPKKLAPYFSPPKKSITRFNGGVASSNSSEGA